MSELPIFPGAVNISYGDANQIIYTDGEGETHVYAPGDIAWVLCSTALVWLMIPGLGFFYAGLLRRKNALQLMGAGVMILAVVSFEWFFWGYSLAFSETGSAYIGDLRYFGLKGVLAEPSVGSATMPALAYCIFQGMFAAITPMLALGAVAERGRLGPSMIFAFVWSTIVYNPIACWTWSPNGWSYQMGGLDFAGGTPVHISSGTAALAISIFLGKREGYGTERLAYKPHNTSYVILGTVLLWFGWFGFNGGSALGANLKAVMAMIVTNLSASVGGITWMLWDYRLEKKWSAVGFCSGAISGLIAITPGSGYVGAPASILFGFMAGTVCNFATQLKFFLNYDDTLDIFATHAIGGMLGNILTALFAQRTVGAYDGVLAIDGGWIDHHYVQLGYQVADSVAGMAYSFVMTTIILWIMHYIPYCSMRSNVEAEIIGMDEFDMGEFAYDYVGIDNEIGHDIEARGVGHTGGGREPDHHHHAGSSQSSHEEKRDGEVATAAI